MAFKDSHHGVSMSSRPYTPRRLFSNFESNRSWNSEVIAIGSVSDRSTPAYVYTSNFLISFKSSFETCWNMLKLDIELSENNARRTSTLQHTQHTQPKSLEISRLQLVHMCLSLGRGVCPGFTRRGSSCKYTLYINIYLFMMHNILNWALNWEVDEKWDDGFWCILLQPQPATHFHGSEVLSCWGLRHHPPRPGRQVDWLSCPGLPCNNDVLVLHSPQNWHKSAETQKSENLEGSHFGAIRVYLPQVHEACDSQRFRFWMLDSWSVGKRRPSTEVSRTCGSNGWSPLLA